MNKQISLIGIPFHGGQRKQGTELAPNVIRQRGGLQVLKDNGYNIEDLGNVVEPEIAPSPVADYKPRRSNWVGKTCQSLYEKIKNAKSENFVLNIGGDHSIAIGTLYGMLARDPTTCIIWVDAHADINTPLTSHSGNIHGMPVSFVAQKPEPLHQYWTVPGFEWTANLPGLDLSRLVYIGLRDVDPGETEILAKYNVKHYTGQQVHDMGIEKVMDETFAYLPKNCKIHLSLDVDGMDPVFFPSTGTPVAGGLTLADGMYICKRIMSTGRCVGMDLVEVNLSLGNEADKEVTLANSIEILKCL